jgi:FixJ family two-component response regulator
VGLRVETFGTAEEFLRRQSPDGPSCLILDLRLPVASGLDVQDSLIDAGVPIPIIFITGHGDIPTTVQAMKSGAVEFLTKPFDDQDLLNAIREALDRDRAAREFRRELGELQVRRVSEILCVGHSMRSLYAPQTESREAERRDPGADPC